MISGIYKLVDGSLVQKLRFDNISNNLANVSTTAFKRDIISFNQIPTMDYFSETDFQPGPITYTGNKLDLALVDHGFFKIRTPRGIRYTRDGSFALNAEGVLVTHRGDTVLGEQGPVRIEGSDISIKVDGEIVVDGQTAGKIAVVDFENRGALRKEGQSYFRYTGEGKGEAPAARVEIRQNYLERSNVNPTEEMIKMLEAYRAFESTQKAIQCIDEITRRLVNDAALLQ